MRNITRRVIPFAALADFYREVTTDRRKIRQSQLRRQVSEWKRGKGTFLADTSADQVNDWLANGYDFEPGSLPEMPVNDATAPTWRSNDEDGDYLHEEFLAGEADFYMDRVEEQTRPGIYLHVEVAFSGGIPGETVKQYGLWVGRAVAAIQSAGFDVALRITSTVDSLYPHEPGRHQTAVQVSRFGEVLLPRDYAVLFTGGGYRHLLFAAKMMCGEVPIKPEGFEGEYKTLVPAREGLGMPYRRDWDVSFDAESRILSVSCNSRSSHFPERAMDDQLREVQAKF